MVFFISDVHLGYFDRDREREREELLVAVLDRISEDCGALYIVGDLFDYWFEYKKVIPKFFLKTLSAFYSMRKKGIEIEYLMGNHDFGHIDFFQKELGIPIYKDDIEREILGKRFYISHGDGKAHNDGPYLFLKKILRSPISMKLYQKLHPDFGIGLASGSSKKSRTYTDKKDYGMSDGMFEFAEKKIAEGFDYVVMGHRHRRIYHDFGRGKYINLGDWFSNPAIGRFDGAEFSLVPVNEFLSP